MNIATTIYLFISPTLSYFPLYGYLYGLYPYLIPIYLFLHFNIKINT